MTCKLIALYNRPPDEAAFLDHYERVHLPLVNQVPGLERTVVNRVFGPAHQTDLFMIAELHFPDRETFDRAMESPENRAAGQDLRNFARGLVSIVFSQTS